MFTLIVQASLKKFSKLRLKQLEKTYQISNVHFTNIYSMNAIYTQESHISVLSMQLQIAIKYEHIETNVRFGAKPCMKMSHFEIAELIQNFHKKQKMLSLPIFLQILYFFVRHIVRNLLIKNS